MAIIIRSWVESEVCFSVVLLLILVPAVGSYPAGNRKPLHNLTLPTITYDSYYEETHNFVICP